MHVLIPKQLGYEELKRLMRDHYAVSTSGKTDVCMFDWRHVERVSLPYVVGLLNWSSRLTHMKVRVHWLFAQPLAPVEGEAELQFWADIDLPQELYSEIQKRINALKRLAVYGRLYPRLLFDSIEEIKNLPKRNRRISTAALEWIRAETKGLEYMNLIGYLRRYEVFERAVEIGIEISPKPEALPHTIMSRTKNTGCLELRPIQSTTAASDVVDQFCDPEELGRVLGEYADLDIVRRGALAQILVRELGNNVGEHAHASSAWLCTRIVRKEQARYIRDPMLQRFRKHSDGFLEIIVCDNGRGLTYGLAEVLNNDERESVRAKYENNVRRRNHSLQLIDYAFDRLSSTKRDILQLVHFERQAGPRRAVPSGLYWVWNVVRSHHGVLAIHTANSQAWYDFTLASGASAFQSWESRHPTSDTNNNTSCGTIIRIFLPLKNVSPSDTPMPRSRSVSVADEAYSVPVYKSSIKIVWVGDLARSVPLRLSPLTQVDSTKSQALLPGMEGSHEATLLRQLQLKHFPLKDGDILVLDLCGMRNKWATHSVAALCHFFLEMNYTSTVGRSAVVLWNVPASARELFENAIELAGEPYSHLEDFRRGSLMIFDDESSRLFCGWNKAEKILNLLKYEGELDLDTREIQLDNDEMVRLRRFVTENSHLFDWLDQSRIRLRPWWFTLRAEAWRQGQIWLNDCLQKATSEDGVLLTLKKGYFRLPSNGLYVKSFYQFRGLLSNHQNCSRIAWHVALVIKLLVAKYKAESNSSILLVSVSRSTMPLVQHLSDNYYATSDETIRAIAASSLQELEASGPTLPANQHAILITDVISSGLKCEQIAKVLPGIFWIGTIALLDTRETTVKPKIIELEPGISVFKTADVATGPIYSLAHRPVKKLLPEKVGIKQPIVVIDEINVCAVVNPTSPEVEADVWEYLDCRPSALQVGHIPGDYHHYIYYVDINELLDSANPSNGQSLLHFMVEEVVNDLSVRNCDPDDIVIMHPPSSSSCGERIGKRVQEATGALYRHTLYKDNIAGHWRFSPFVQHGLPLAGCTLVLIDDGANTAETLMGLLDAATFGYPARVFAYVGVTRMPPHKNHLFLKMRSLKNVTGEVNISFTLMLAIPVYSQKDCSICKFRNDLARVEEYSFLLRKYAQSLQDSLITSGKSEGTNENADFLWKYDDPMTVAKLREAFETLDYKPASSERVNVTLRTACARRTNSISGLLDLGFIICSESEIADSTVLVPYIKKLIAAASAQLPKAQEPGLMTLIGLSFHLMYRWTKNSTKKELTNAVRLLWERLLKRERLTIDQVGKIVSFLLAEGLKERDVKRGVGEIELSKIWMESLRERIDEPPVRHRITSSLAPLQIREALTILQGSRPSYSPNQGVRGRVDLYELADNTASEFWWHASDNVKGYIDILLEALNLVAQNSEAAQTLIYGPIHQLARAFNDLYELQQRLCETEEESQHRWHERSGAEVYWNTPELSNAIGQCVQAFTNIAEFIADRDLATRRLEESTRLGQALNKAWEDLYRLLVAAFDSIFPQVLDVVGERWDNFQRVTALPHVADKGVIATRHLSRHARVFFPRTLLSRFLTVGMLNLKTAAFKHWTKAQIDLHARAFIEIESSPQDRYEDPVITVRIVDNGSFYKREGTAQSEGQGKGLDDIGLMAQNFRAVLRFPVTTGDKTAVELQMVYRTVRSSRHVNS